MIQRDYFFENIKYYLFGTMDQDQVDGCNLFLDWYDNENAPPPELYHFDDRCLAYILATVYHETAFTMQPVKEYGGESYLKSKPYYPWYGRGHVQLTWEDNYKRQDEKLSSRGIIKPGELLATPDLALEPRISLYICTWGMYDGDFTGKSLGDFFTETETNWYDARTIVNGHDRASTIGGYGEKFLNALTAT
jgi:putative chitinase